MRIFKFIKYYLEPDDKYVRGIAYNAAREYFKIPVRNDLNPYPRPIDYERRRREFVRYQRAFNHAYRLDYAKTKLGEI
jgi:hypothetical protein